MEDKRVQKTKKTLRNTMLDLLESKDFEDISVTELCEQAQISRITFYSHYSDKYELINDLFENIINDTTAFYYAMERENNPAHDPVESYCNLLECILDICYNKLPVFANTGRRDSYLIYSTYQYIMKYVRIVMEKASEKLRPKFPVDKTTSFICNGILGYVNICLSEKNSPDAIRCEVRDLLRSLIGSDVLFYQN